MKKLLIIGLIVLGLSGCVFRQSQQVKINKGLHVVRAAILEAVNMVEATHDQGFISKEQYEEKQAQVLYVVHKYNMAVKFTNVSKVAEVIELIETLAEIKNEMKGYWHG